MEKLNRNEDYQYILNWTKRRGALNPIVYNFDTFFAFMYREDKLGVEEPLKIAWEKLDKEEQEMITKELGFIFKEYKKERQLLGVEK